MALQDLRLALDAATRAQAWGAVESIQKRIDKLEAEHAIVLRLVR